MSRGVSAAVFRDLEALGYDFYDGPNSGYFIREFGDDVTAILSYRDDPTPPTKLRDPVTLGIYTRWSSGDLPWMLFQFPLLGAWVRARDGRLARVTWNKAADTMLNESSYAERIVSAGAIEQLVATAGVPLIVAMAVRNGHVEAVAERDDAFIGIFDIDPSVNLSRYGAWLGPGAWVIPLRDALA